MGLSRWEKATESSPSPLRPQRASKRLNALAMNTLLTLPKNKELIFHTLAELDPAALAQARWFQEPSTTPIKAFWMKIKSTTGSSSLASLTQLLTASSKLTKKTICSEKNPHNLIFEVRY